MNQMNLGRVDLNLLVVFHHVAECRSVTGAAERLNLSQPAVSHALNRLRTLIGDPLFVRGKGGLGLTSRAIDLIEPVRAVLDAIQRALAPSTFDPAETTRRFRMGASEYTALTLLPDLVRHLHRHAPKASFAFEAIDGAFVDRLASGEIEAVFWGTVPPGDPLVSAELFRETQVGAVGSRHPLAAKARLGKVELDDYLTYPHIRVNYAAGVQGQVDATLAGMERTRLIAVETPHFGSNTALLRDTSLVLTLPSRLFQASKDGDVVTFPLPFPVPDFVYSLVWHRRTESDPGAMWLRDRIFEAVRGSVDDAAR